jgi:hypothetical protein
VEPALLFEPWRGCSLAQCNSAGRGSPRAVPAIARIAAD